MKKLLIGITLLGSMSSFGYDQLTENSETKFKGLPFLEKEFSVELEEAIPGADKSLPISIQSEAHKRANEIKDELKVEIVSKLKRTPVDVKCDSTYDLRAPKKYTYKCRYRFY